MKIVHYDLEILKLRIKLCGSLDYGRKPGVIIV